MITEKVLIPLLRAAITGLLFALFAAAFFVGSIPWRVFWLVLAGVCLVSWLAVILPTNDIKPRIYPTTTKVEIVARDPSGAYRAGVWADLPVDPAAMAEVARRINAGVSFSHAGLAGPYKPLSRSQYEALRDAMIARGLAYWINPASHSQGVCLSRAGDAVMRHFATPHPKILPRAMDPPRRLQAHTRTHKGGILRD
jgi:hypothetical protein